MTVVEAELKRRDATLALVDWLLANDTANTATGKSDPVIDFGARARLVEIRDALVAGVTVDTGLLQGLTLAELVALLPLPVDTGLTTQTDALTDAELRATPVPVSDQHAQPLTDTQLRLSPVPVDTGLTQPILDGGNVVVGNFPASFPDQHSQPLTDAQLRATSVPVDTGLTTQTDALTDAQLRASVVPVSDDYPDGEILPDQTGAGGVLTFTFAAPVQTVWVAAVDPADLSALGEVRVDPYGGVPSATFGIPVGYGGAFPIPAVTSTVAVFAPSGARVTVIGNRR